MSLDTAASAGPSSTLTKHNVLLDVSFGVLGYSGIPQDSRLMYSTLAQSPGVNVTGLFYPLGRAVPSVVRQRNSKEIDRVASSSLLIADISEGRNLHLGGLRHPTQALRVLLYFRHLMAGNCRLWDVPMDILGDTVWRLLFEKTLPETQRTMVQQGRFMTGNFSLVNVVDRTMRFSSLGPLKMPTGAHDFVIFHDSRRIKVSPNTRKLIRYHDPIPITHPDTVVRSHTDLHIRALRYCAADSFYVCNSEPVREELVRLEPRLENRSITIPYRIEQARKSPNQEIPALEIVRTRLSFISLGHAASSRVTERVEGEIQRAAERQDQPKYIMAISELEPRKNFIGVIRAWERLRASRDKDLKLIIVGNPGWRDDSILAAMKPWVAAGQLWHVQGLPSAELQALYRQAVCLVFPSFAEGFGFPPIEAMVHGTPAVVSNLAVHRWVMGDAVLYADPYDIDAIAEQIGRLACDPDKDRLRMELRQNGQRVLARYDQQTIENQWCSLFDELRTKSPR
jgi:glycosyltransferase involved in cell wall biosynthesis